MQPDLRWLVAGLGLSASALGALGCDAPSERAAPTATVTAVPIGSDGERVHPPEGKWCGKPETAKGLVILGSPEVDGCPKFLDGARIPKEKELRPEYIDMPRSTYGFYDDILTKMRRSGINHAPLCCYNWREKAPGGRPLILPENGDVALVAPLAPGSLHPRLPAPELQRPPPKLAPRVFEYWRLQAQLEHASVASFARARLELLALGAPRDLIARYAAAAQDELRHAALSLAVLEAWGQRGLSFGPIAVQAAPRRGASRDAALRALARRTLDEAFEPESAAALALFGAAERADCPNLARVLHQIAEEERGHARLALDTVGWCLAESGSSLDVQPTSATAAYAPTHPLDAWGVVSDAAWVVARQQCRALGVVACV